MLTPKQERNGTGPEASSHNSAEASAGPDHEPAIVSAIAGAMAASAARNSAPILDAPSGGA